MNIIRRPVSAVLAIALGVVALVAAASLLMLRDGGWPWHAGIAATSGAATAEIVEEDGTAYRFSGTPAEAQIWLDGKQDELKQAHGIPAKIAAGRVLQPVGLVLVLLGLARLLMTARRPRSVSGLLPD